MESDLPLTGGSASERSALCSASIHRKEKHGYRQESNQEARREKSNGQETCRKETRRKETGREESNDQEPGREKGGGKETRCEAQAQRRVHEADDTVVGTRRR